MAVATSAVVDTYLWLPYMLIQAVYPEVEFGKLERQASGVISSLMCTRRSWDRNGLKGCTVRGARTAREDSRESAETTPSQHQRFELTGPRGCRLVVDLSFGIMSVLLDPLDISSVVLAFFCLFFWACFVLPYSGPREFSI